MLTPGPCPLSASDGVLVGNGHVQIIDMCGQVRASASISAPSLQQCARGGLDAVLATPVSTTNDLVFYRDGDTKVRSLTRDGQTAEVTTVPGGSSTVSFFSVSPDDQRIAVLVEDFSSDYTIGLKLYVEDLQGGTHHDDIYATTTRKGESGRTLWPIGWHQGMLVLVVFASCTLGKASLDWVRPLGIHVVDPLTGSRRAQMGNERCEPSRWPSQAGVACVDIPSTGASVFDWKGKLIRAIPSSPDEGMSSLSPSGKNILFDGGPTQFPFTHAVGDEVEAHVSGHAGCFWLDEHHIFAPDAILTVPTGVVTSFVTSGECAGRIPGGL